MVNSLYTQEKILVIKTVMTDWKIKKHNEQLYLCFEEYDENEPECECIPLSEWDPITDRSRWEEIWINMGDMQWGKYLNFIKIGYNENGNQTKIQYFHTLDPGICWKALILAI